MIRTQIYLPKYDWTVDVYFAVDCYYTYEILNRMRMIGCSGDTLVDAHRNLTSCSLNSGLCYSNTEKHRSVMVTSLTSCAKEFLNSLMHECRHLQQHIATAYGMDEDSEDVCYLMGEIGEQVYPACRRLLCDECRHVHKRRCQVS